MPSPRDHAIYEARVRLNGESFSVRKFERVARQFGTTPTLAFLAFYRVSEERHRGPGINEDGVYTLLSV